MAEAHMVGVREPGEGPHSLRVFTDRLKAHLYACKLSADRYNERVFLVTYDEGEVVSSVSYTSEPHTVSWTPPYVPEP